jgi:glycerol-3-phosphate acyltransferase PlsY
MNIAIYIISYFVGAIPFGYLIAKRKGIDIMSVGSGNAGATNVLRTLGRGPGLFVFFLDTLKGLLPCILAYQVTHSRELTLLCGFCAILGHCMSPFLKFKGGKGVSTGLGVLLASSPIVGIGALLTFLIVVLITRFVSLGSILSAIAMMILGVVVDGSWLAITAYSLVAAFIIYKHRSNIVRLLHGTETKFSWKLKTATK